MVPWSRFYTCSTFNVPPRQSFWLLCNHNPLFYLSFDSNNCTNKFYISTFRGMWHLWKSEGHAVDTFSLESYLKKYIKKLSLIARVLKRFVNKQYISTNLSFPWLQILYNQKLIFSRWFSPQNQALFMTWKPFAFIMKTFSNPTMMGLRKKMDKILIRLYQ